MIRRRAIDRHENTRTGAYSQKIPERSATLGAGARRAKGEMMTRLPSLLRAAIAIVASQREKTSLPPSLPPGAPKETLRESPLPHCLCGLQVEKAALNEVVKMEPSSKETRPSDPAAQQTTSNEVALPPPNGLHGLLGQNRDDVRERE